MQFCWTRKSGFPGSSGCFARSGNCTFTLSFFVVQQLCGGKKHFCGSAPDFPSCGSWSHRRILVSHWSFCYYLHAHSFLCFCYSFVRLLSQIRNRERLSKKEEIGGGHRFSLQTRRGIC